MPIEDVDYLKQNSQKQSYIFLVNSKDRDKLAYPTPTEYVVDFSQPYTNVIGLNVLDASIPRTMYNIDVYNNSLYYFIHSSNYDLNTLAESSFAEAKIDPGDYTIQTLIDTLNDQLVMPLNSNVNNCNVNIVVSSVTNPPDIQNKIQFYSAYPFMFDMKRSTIAESLGFDTYIQSSEKNKANLDKDYVPFFFTDGVYITSNDVINVYTSLKQGVSEETLAGTYSTSLINQVKPFVTNNQLYHSVDLPYNEARGTTYTIFEGPRGVIRQVSLTNNVAQRFYVPYDTRLTRVYVALAADNLSPSSAVDFDIQTHNSTTNRPSGTTILTDATVAISYIDGTLSDSEVLSTPLTGGNYYWIIFKPETNIGIYYNDVLVGSNTLYKYNGATWDSLDDTINDVYYNLSMNIEVTDDYHRIKAPGIYSLIGEPYLVIRCKEIEENSYRSLAYTKHQLGIAKIKLGVVGYREERIDFASIPNREFHPIGRLSRLTLRFETGSGQPYDFKGVNHNITFGIQYYEPIQKRAFQQSIINTNYNGDFMNYMYRQEEQEEESDDQDTDYNRDALQQYREAESRNLPWQVAQRNIQQYYDLNIDEDEDD